MALTASAPTDVQECIVRSLHLRSPVFVHGDIDRPNIYLSLSVIKSLSVSLMPKLIVWCVYRFLTYANDSRETWMV